jgi:SagB-type dehydrogenase family enzyme
MRRFVFIFLCVFFYSVTSPGLSGAQMNTFKLPEPEIRGDYSLDRAIEKRRSVRGYLDKSLTAGQISDLLWAAQGVTDKRSGHRAAPSAGAIYPLTLYAVKDEGVWRYNPGGHSLDRISADNLKEGLARAALNQGFVAQAAVSIVISVNYDKITSRYGERGVMYAHMEAGHAAQNLHLKAVSLDLASVPVGAFSEREVKDLLGLPREETPVYIIPVGHKR